MSLAEIQDAGIGRFISDDTQIVLHRGILLADLSADVIPGKPRKHYFARYKEVANIMLELIEWMINTNDCNGTCRFAKSCHVSPSGCAIHRSGKSGYGY